MFKKCWLLLIPLLRAPSQKLPKLEGRISPVSPRRQSEFTGQLKQSLGANQVPVSLCQALGLQNPMEPGPPSRTYSLVRKQDNIYLHVDKSCHLYTVLQNSPHSLSTGPWTGSLCIIIKCLSGNTACCLFTGTLADGIS